MAANRDPREHARATAWARPSCWSVPHSGRFLGWLLPRAPAKVTASRRSTTLAIGTATSFNCSPPWPPTPKRHRGVRPPGLTRLPPPQKSQRADDGGDQQWRRARRCAMRDSRSPTVTAAPTSSSPSTAAARRPTPCPGSVWYGIEPSPTRPSTTSGRARGEAKGGAGKAALVAFLPRSAPHPLPVDPSGRLVG